MATKPSTKATHRLSRGTLARAVGTLITLVASGVLDHVTGKRRPTRLAFALLLRFHTLHGGSRVGDTLLTLVG